MAFGEGIRNARRGEPEVIILAADSLVGADALISIEELEAAIPHAAVIVLTTSTDAGRLRDFVLAGARDCLAPPYTRETLVNSVRKVHQNETRRRDRLTASITGGLRQHRCQVIAVHGAKGGVGTTTVAVNVATALRLITKERIAIVDASLQAGDVGIALDVVANTSLDDLLPHLNGLDADLLNKVLVTHSTGLRALLAPRDLERVDSIGAEEVRRILAFLTGHFDYIVIDTAPSLDAAGLAALDHADQIVLVTTPEVPALKNAGRFLQLSRRLGYPIEKVALVVNRARGQQAIPIADIEKSLGIKHFATVPSAGKTFIRAANHGEVVVLRGGMGGASRSLFRLAERLTVSTGERRRPSLIGRLPGAGLFRRPPGPTTSVPPQTARANADASPG